MNVPQIVSDTIQRMTMLANDRLAWETVWSDVATYAFADHARIYPGSISSVATYDQLSREPSSVERARVRFDDTMIHAAERLTSGMESLATPQSGKWHGMAVLDPLAPEETEEEKVYFERLRDYIFSVRYNPKAGFIGAHQKALRSAITLGTGITFIEENIGADDHAVPAMWRYLPLSECYLAVNAQGNPDTLYREFMMTARQQVQRFGVDKCSEQMVREANLPSGKDIKHTVIHAVQPRAEAGSYGATNRKAAYSSCYIDLDNNHLIGESGFYEFPFVVYYWQPVENMAYAQSPVMMALSDIKGLNAIRKTTLRGFQQYFDPPMAIAHDGIMNRPNLNPRAINYNAIDSNGRMRIQPIVTQQRPDFAMEVIKAERDSVNESMYVNLFQILINKPDMTATEAMIIANEKGELLGPAGGKIQHAMSCDTDRIVGIVERKGAMLPKATLAPPQSLKGRNIGTRFTSPLDRLRLAGEGLGIQRTLQTLLPLAQAKPEVLDNLDTDYTVRKVGEIEGAPQQMWVSVEQRDANRQARQQQMQTQQVLEMAKTGGDAASKIVPAMQGMQQLAGLPQQPPPTGPRPNA